MVMAEQRTNVIKQTKDPLVASGGNNDYRGRDVSGIRLKREAVLMLAGFARSGLIKSFNASILDHDL